ncbi:MAG: hypothetical protein E7353_06590 [Clostridiales bacterium]|nr:hypothetical protein [Clostridiales bacterium]
MKRLRRIFNILLSLLIVLTLTGCAGIEAELTSCLEQFSESFDNSSEKPPQEDNGVPQSIELVFPEGRFSSTADTATYRDCYVLVNGKWSYSSYDIEWRFDGETSSHEGGLYTFAPSSFADSVTVEAVIKLTEITDEVDENGEFVESVTELIAKETFVYYTPFETPTAKHSNEGGVETYSIDGFTENDVIEWYLNGEKVYEGAEFVCDPPNAGRYTVSATVNGIDATVENPLVVKTGAQTVTNVKVDFDTYYPNVLISFDGDPNASYIIRKTYGSSKNEYIATTNSFLISYDDFFSDSSVSNYYVSVKTLDDEVYENSQYSATYSVKRPSSYANYLSKTYGLENAYITSKEDFYEQFDHMMLTRPQPTTTETKLTRQFYFAYKIDGSIRDLVNEAFDACGYTGSYRLNAYGSNPYTVEVYFKTSNVAELPSTSNIPSAMHFSSNMNGYPLAISREGSESSLPIDAKTKITVSNTDQVYRMAELGYCPNPTSGSVAETVLKNARSVLSVIIDEGMSDYEIALAIYDWVMYKNSYNNEVLTLTTERAVKHPAFYLEGIMYSGSYGFAVCDGISKTYSLLCNMAGVECLRVVGEAGQNGAWGGHAWNKVKVDGNWYVVDATWGDVSMGISYKSGSYWNSSTYTDYYEMGMHNYFLVTDAFIKDNHKEDSDVYPKTAPIPYNHYAKRTMQSGENVVDMYVNETGEELKTKLDVIADAIVADVKAKNRVQEFSVGGTTKQSYYFFYELGYSPLAKSNVLKYMTSSSSFAKKLKNQNYGFSLFEMDGAVGIIVSYHYGNRLPSSSLQIG